MTALALRDDQEYWDENQLAVLRANGIEEGVTRAELQVYLHECQRRRLDPFTRQIYLIGRWDTRQKRKVYRSQTGIDGFRVIARRAADEAKETIEYEDTLWCGPDGKWTDVWLDDQPPAACKVVVLRDGKRFPTTAKYSSYVQVNDNGNPVGLWRKMPDNQLAKCTEALALRKAFPEDLGGLYTEEEMAQADNPQTVRAVSAEVVHEERLAVTEGIPSDETWYVRPAAETALATVDQEWLDAAIERAMKLESGGEAAALRQETADKAASGAITAEDAERVYVMINARGEDLKHARSQQQAGPEPSEAEKALARLDPEDEWTLKVREIPEGDDDAARAVLAELAESKVKIAKGHLIRDAILTGWPGAAEPEAA